MVNYWYHLGGYVLFTEDADWIKKIAQWPDSRIYHTYYYPDGRVYHDYKIPKHLLKRIPARDRSYTP